MNVSLNPQISSISLNMPAEKLPGSGEGGVNFGKAVNKSLQSVNDHQSEANTSIADLLSGKSQDINSVIASVAKADMSFKLLVGVRNKLVEAYKETMKMQL